jgi:hypothetical protein
MEMTYQRGPCEVKKYTTGRGIGCPANRKGITRFAEGNAVLK